MKKLWGWGLVQSAIIALVCLAVLGIIAHVRFGSLRNGLQYLRGHRLLVDSPAAQLGIVNSGEVRDVIFHITNHTEKSVRILGCETGCQCMVSRGLPVAIGPGETAEVVITVSFKASGNDTFFQPLSFITDLEGTRVTASISAKIQGGA